MIVEDQDMSNLKIMKYFSHKHRLQRFEAPGLKGSWSCSGYHTRLACGGTWVQIPLRANFLSNKYSKICLFGVSCIQLGLIYTVIIN